jgi:hypothetical protein
MQLLFLTYFAQLGGLQSQWGMEAVDPRSPVTVLSFDGTNA